MAKKNDTVQRVTIIINALCDCPIYEKLPVNKCTQPVEGPV